MHKGLNERIIISNNASSIEKDEASRPMHYCQWDNVSMIKAISAVENGMTVRRASECFGVPKSSLHDRISGKVQHGKRPGPISYLTVEEESELANFLIRCADIGYPHSLPQVLGLVQEIIEYKGINASVSYGWWQRFCQHNKEVSLRTAVPLARVRAMATDVKVLEKYFDILEQTLKDNKIFNNPTRIYNCDETGLSLSPKGIKVVAKRGSKNVSGISGDNKTQITVLACTSASGICIPPMVIFDRKTLNPELTTGEVPGTIYGLSKSGWINRELFMEWFYRHFLLCVPSVRPLLLVMDDHFSLDVIRVAAEQYIILFTLPPHTSHLTLPLDRGCFSSLKGSWKKVCHQFYAKNPGQVITRFDFSSLFSESWKLAMTPKNIMSGFSITGVCPFSKAKVLAQVPMSSPEMPKKFKPELLAQRTGLAYIPLYSPVRERIPSKYNEASEYPSFSSMSSECDLYNETSTPRKVERSSSESCLFDMSHCNYTLQRSTSIGQFLHKPKHPSLIPTKYQKSSGKVLTSLENQVAIEEKARKKEKEMMGKEHRRAIRQEKAQAKLASASSKKTSATSKKTSATSPNIVVKAAVVAETKQKTPGM